MRRGLLALARLHIGLQVPSQDRNGNWCCPNVCAEKHESERFWREAACDLRTSGFITSPVLESSLLWNILELAQAGTVPFDSKLEQERVRSHLDADWDCTVLLRSPERLSGKAGFPRTDQKRWLHRDRGIFKREVVCEVKMKGTELREVHPVPP